MAGGGEPRGDGRAKPCIAATVESADRKEATIGVAASTAPRSRSWLAYRSMIVRAWLTLRVHWDAFSSSPLGYVQAALWRARGLRVRSRHRLAALMGPSTSAYALWIARLEPRIHAELVQIPVSRLPVILTIVSVPRGDHASSTTLESIADGGASSRPILIGGVPAERAVHLDTASQVAALVAPTGTWLCILNDGDRLASTALAIYARAVAANPDRWIIYSDDDLIQNGRRTNPHFKSDWNSELFDHHDFITGSAIVRATPEMVLGLSGDDWAGQLVLAGLGRGDPVHVPAVLHHRRARPGPRIPPKPTVIVDETAPLVSVIIPTRNQLPLLRTCIEGLVATSYPRTEVIVIDNGSDDPATLAYLDGLRGGGVEVLTIDGPFNFSALNNSAAARASGDLICFLNNDIEIIDPDWLSLLVRKAVRDDLGAVGGRLLYPDGTIQHAGVVTGVGGGAAHAHRFQREDEDGYFSRDRLPQRVSAVTAACLVVSKQKFEAVGGFNERDFPVAFNDVDLCLKLNRHGWQSFYEPRAVLIHHESKSRGSDSAKENRQRFAEELAALKRHWGTDCTRDPYHHPNLSPFCEKFVIGL